MLEVLQALARDPDNEGITLVQPRGDKGMDQLLSIWQGEGGEEFGNVFEVEKGDLTEVADVVVKCEVWIQSDSDVGNRGSQGNVMTKNGYTTEGEGLGLMCGTVQDGFGFADI